MGGVYAELGAYYTDQRVADAIAANLPIREGDSVLEGHAGGGAILSAFLALPRKLDLYAMDVDPRCPAMTAPAPRYHRRVQSFLGEPVICTRPDTGQDVVAQTADPYPDDWPRPTWIVGNPPYGVRVPGRKSAFPVAHHHVRRALELTGRHVVLLLRAGFATATSYVHLLTGDNTPRELWFLFPRPGFAGAGTDMAAYVVIWWDRQHDGPCTVRWIGWKGPA